MIVADANLIVYLVLAQSLSPEAEIVYRKDPDWAAPLFWRSEVRNVLAKYVRRGDITLPEALSMMRDAEEIMWGREFRVESGPVLALAGSSGCSAYDCEYVHLAQELDVTLVTDDRKVLAAFPSTATRIEAFAA